MIFRTLTKLSRLKFGRYADRTVGEVMDILQKREYIIWAYYNSSHISFADDILLECGIELIDRIDKPGTSPGKEKELMTRLFNKIRAERVGGEEGLIQYHAFLRRKKANMVVKKVESYRRAVLPKSKMQAYNHGR